MFGQTFQPVDIASVGLLILLEGLLSADNALVLAIMVRHLPRNLQQRALLYGLGGAFVFRFIAIIFATIVLKQWWLQALGGAYLLFLPIKHFLSRSSGGHDVKPKGGGFWQTVIAVEFTDIAFALDSILAAIGFISERGQIRTDKIWVVYVGAIIGIVLLRFAAGAFIRLLEKFPALDHMAYLLVGWVGVKLGFHAAFKFQEISPGTLPFSVPYMSQGVFWGGMALIIAVGSFIAFTHPRNRHDLDEQADIEADVKDLSIDDPAEEPSAERKESDPR